MSDDAADIAVVGLGVVGSAVACAAARRGARVVGIDRFQPPHVHGSSHGRTRITRLAVGEGEDYVPLAQRSHALWRELEAATGLALMRQTGVLMVASPLADAGSFHGQTGFFDRTCALARQFGIAHELLSAAAVRRRFPAFTPDDDHSAYFEPEGGVLYAEDCVRAQWQVAQSHGAVLHAGERLLGIASTASGVTLTTDRGERHASRAVLTTGAWLPRQVGGTFANRLRVLRQVLHWFEPEDATLFDAARCPPFIWLHGPAMEDAFYGFPMLDGLPGVKLATEFLSQATDPDSVERQVGAAEAHALFERHVRGRLSGLRRRTVHEATCLYTMAADGRFVVEPHPQHERVLVVSACSGHGFKHAPALGEAVAGRLLSA